MEEEYREDAQDEAPDTGQGEGEAQEAQPDYAGFQSPEELAAAYQRVLADKEGLESLKGRMGNELGRIRNEHARLSGMVEALQSAKQESARQGISTAAIYEQLENGDISEAKALQMMEAALESKYKNEISRVHQDFTKFRENYESERYVQEFLSKPENAGYKEAYQDGKLDRWINQGIPGEMAWVYFKAERAEAKARELEQKIASAKTEAEKLGLQRGAQLERGKNVAGKVLGEGPGGRIADKPGYRSKVDRTSAGVQYLERLRSRTI